MKLFWSRLLSLMLILCLLAPMALAEDEAEAVVDEEEIPAHEETVDYIQNVLMVNGTMFVSDFNYIYKAEDDGWSLVNLLGDKDGSVAAVTDAEDGVYAFVSFWGSWDNEGNYIEPESRFSIYRVPVNEAGEVGKGELVCNVDLELNTDDIQVFGIAMMDNQAYLLVFDYADEWDYNSIYRVDLATGKGKQLLKDHISNLKAYKGGKLMAVYFNREESYDENWALVKMPTLVAIDPATGDMSELAELTGTNIGGFVYDAQSDAVYYSERSFVYSVGDGQSEPQVVGYIPGSSLYGRSDCSVAIHDGRYYIGDVYSSSEVGGTPLLSATIDPALLPSRTLRVSNAWSADDAIRAYSKEHPEVAVEYVETSLSTADQYKQHMESAQKADIYQVVLPYSPFAVLRNKGGLADLASSEKLVEITGRMYPHLTGEFFRDGKLYGVPVYMSASSMGVYTEALEKVGLEREQLPTTYGEMMDFMTEWYYDYYDDFEDMSFFEWADDLRGTLFQMIFEARVLSCKARGERITFNTPEMMALLNRLDSNEMKEVFETIGPKRDDNGNVLEMVYYDDVIPGLFSNYFDVTPQRYRQWTPVEPLLLKVDGDEQPVIGASLYLLVANYRSENLDLVIDFLEYMAENMPQYLKAALMPDENDPIETSYYQQEKEMFEEEIVKMEERLAKLKESGEEEDEVGMSVEDMERQLQLNRETLVSIEADRWAFSEEDMKNYRENIAPYLVVTASNVLSGENNPVASAISMYIDRASNMDAQALVNRIDQVINDMEEENR